MFLFAEIDSQGNHEMDEIIGSASASYTLYYSTDLRNAPRDLSLWDEVCSGSGGVLNGELCNIDDSFPNDITLLRLVVNDNGVEAYDESIIFYDPVNDFIRGDSNLDGDITLEDPISILRYLFAGEELECLDAGDVKDTGYIDLSDPLYLLEYMFQGGPRPLLPFPDKGVDPTDDNLNCATPLDDNLLSPPVDSGKIVPSEYVDEVKTLIPDTVEYSNTKAKILAILEGALEDVEVEIDKEDERGVVEKTDVSVKIETRKNPIVSFFERLLSILGIDAGRWEETETFIEREFFDGEEVELTGSLEIIHQDDFENPENSKYSYFLNVVRDKKLIKRYELISDFSIDYTPSNVEVKVKGNVDGDKLTVLQ